MADKVREHNRYVRLKGKYIGVGNADTSREEFFSNIHRDTYASLSHHDPLLTYNALALGMNKELLRQEFIKKMTDK